MTTFEANASLNQFAFMSHCSARDHRARARTTSDGVVRANSA